MAEGDHLFSYAIERVAGAPGGLVFLAPIPEGAARERPVLVEIAVGVSFEDNRPPARPQLFQGLVGGETHCQRVHAVASVRGNAVGESARGQPRLPCSLLGIGGDGDLIVIDEEQDRQIPERCEIEGFGDGPLVQCSVAEEADDNIALARHLARIGDASGDGYAATDDGVGADHARFLPA